MAIGYLIIQARTAHDAVPLKGVQIRILNDEGRSVYELTTDESGETQAIPLETLSRDFSQNQYYTGTPYLSYDVYARAAGFHSLHVSDIPIFEEETAVLPLTLLPMEETQRSPMQAEISVGKPAVAMKQARNQEGTTAESPYILRQVVIPNPITVHLGAPASYASNVQVSFPDYVKNVASSEIYPTWPDAALRANIYAIITFALNRVFTEWYRSRGQDSPYFTSFCNGTTATCQGLSQWGTVTLADQGQSPIQILRSYYPKDIEIAETNIITGVLSSYPGTPLQTGSRGLNVQTIQTYLNRIRQNYPAIPVITDEAGVFGASTKAAVTKFQSIFNLAADGIVGKSTWYKISSLYAGITRLAELDSEGTSLGIGTVPPDSVLRQGSLGPDVITLQYLLNVISEYYPGIPAPSQNGSFDAGTRESVIAFQQMMGLDPDGIVGALTWRTLYDIYLGIEQNVPLPGPGTDTIEYVVRQGDTLWLLSRRYGTTVDAIKRLNGLTGDLLNIGQVLRIPSSQVNPYFEYTVRQGDTLWLLSRRYGTTVDAIKALNGLSSDMLNIGQVLKIPAQ